MPSKSGAQRRRVLLSEIYTDLSWLQYAAGDTEGANEAARLALRDGAVDLSLLQTLIHQTVGMESELLRAAKENLDPKRGTKPSGLLSDNFRSLSDQDAERMYLWSETAGLYAYLGDEQTVKQWTKDFAKGYQVSNLFRGISQLHIAEGYLLAGELDKGFAILKERDRKLAPERRGPVLEGEGTRSGSPPTPDAGTTAWEPTHLTALGISYARALRCAGKDREAHRALDSMNTLPALISKDLLELAQEWGHHGEQELEQQAVLRYLDELGVLVLQSGDDNTFQQFFRDGFLMLLAHGYAEDAQLTVEQFMAMPESSVEPGQAVAQWLLLGMCHYKQGQLELADKAYEQVLLIQQQHHLTELFSPPYAITQSAMRLKQSVDASAFDPIIESHEARDTEPESRLAAVRDAVILSGRRLAMSDIESLNGLPDDIRCGVLLGQMHLALIADGIPTGRAIGRTPLDP
ncbi:MAG: tetratricopeptide repeat protein [Planctomycetota bacterium]